MSKFSIVITTRNRAEALTTLLPEVLNLQYPNVEVVLVDNASEDHTNRVAGTFPVKYIYFPGGLAEARHIGSMAASGDFLTYVDDDCRPGNPDILRQIEAAFQKNADAGIVGSRIENIGFKGMQQFKGYTRFGRNALLEFEPDPPSADVYASMAITIRKDVYLKVGGFDPAFSKGCEEVDLCMKVKAAGYKLIYHPDSFFYHHQMGSHFRFNPIHNRDFMRLYSFFKFFSPSDTSSWMQFLRNEWELFLQDVKQISRQYREENFQSTHLPFLNKFLKRSRLLRFLLRWPLMIGAIVVSPLLRRAFIPYIFWKAQQRKLYERNLYGLSYA